MKCFALAVVVFALVVVWVVFLLVVAAAASGGGGGRSSDVEDAADDDEQDVTCITATITVIVAIHQCAASLSSTSAPLSSQSHPHHPCHGSPSAKTVAASIMNVVTFAILRGTYANTIITRIIAATVAASCFSTPNLILRAYEFTVLGLWGLGLRFSGC